MATATRKRQRISKTLVRKSVGRGKFTAHDLAASLDISVDTAARALRSLEEAEDVEEVGAQKVTDEEGNFTRGRPRKLYRLA